MTIKFNHRNVAGGYITIAFNETGSDTVEYGVAFCSPEDHSNFRRAKGRMIATNRLESRKRIGIIPIPEDTDLIVESIIQDIESGNYQTPAYREGEDLAPKWFFGTF